MNDLYNFEVPVIVDTNLEIFTQIQNAAKAEKLNRQPPRPREMLDRQPFLVAFQRELEKKRTRDPNLVTTSWITG